MVIDELNALSAEYLDKDELEQKIEVFNSVQSQKDKLASELAAYGKKINEYSKGLRDLYMDKVKGFISEADYADMSQGFSRERDRLQRMVAEGERQMASLDEKNRSRRLSPKTH